MERADAKVVPITILTGFLGAGKTTLLNRILNGGHGLRVAVLVNDFGAINIDAELVVGVKDNVVSLANGCVCCTIRGDLLNTVMETVNRPEAPEYILLEASGVADPSGIAMTFVDDAVRDRLRLDSIICVVDADQVFAVPENPDVERLKLRQIAFADMVILNKVDLAGSEQVAKVRTWIDDHFNRLWVVEAINCDVPLEVLLAVGRLDPAASFDGSNADDRVGGHAPCDSHDHDDDRSHDPDATFSTWSFETDHPVSLYALQETVRRKLPASIYRCKGIVQTAEAPQDRTILQVVGRRTEVSIAGTWGNEVPRTRIVAIGARGALNVSDLDALFRRCLATTAGVA
jgi:G3E family GTPase